MKRLMTILMVLGLLVMVTGAGCDTGTEVADDVVGGNGTDVDSGDLGNGTAGDSLEGTVIIAGSTSVQPVSELLAEEFQNMHPQVSVQVQGGGSTAGVVAAEEGTADIGASSRELREDEKHLTEYVVGLDGIAVIVNPANPVEGLTIEQVQQIFAGEITNWSQVEGPSAEIIVATREEGSGTRGAFEEIVMGDASISNTALVQNSTGACRTAVAGDVNAISYVSLAAMDPEVKAVAIDGVAATVENIIAEVYPVFRPFLYLTSGEPTGLAKEFIDFIISPEAQPLIEEAGLISTR